MGRNVRGVLSRVFSYLTRGARVSVCSATKFTLSKIVKCDKLPTSFPGSSLFLPRESTLVSAGHVSPLSKQLPTRVDSLFFKKRREKRMQIFSNWHEDRGMEVISSHFFSKTGTLKKSTVYYLRRFRTTNNADFPSTKYFTVGSICFEFAEGV